LRLGAWGFDGDACHPHRNYFCSCVIDDYIVNGRGDDQLNYKDAHGRHYSIGDIQIHILDFDDI
jgi:hypothetical protein